MDVGNVLLHRIVAEVPVKLATLFGAAIRPEDKERGLCTTYSRVLAESLTESGIQAEVRSVHIVTANRPGMRYLRGKLTAEQSLRKGGKIQYWGFHYTGQAYQHAVCYIPSRNVVVDISMERRGSGLVPSHPFWARMGHYPSWVWALELQLYPLEFRAYELCPDDVEEAKQFIKQIIQEEADGDKA